MIEILNGIKETVVYKEMPGFLLHNNTDYEAYPEHWHTPIEIIMPVENSYDVSAMKEVFTLQEGDIICPCQGLFLRLPKGQGKGKLLLRPAPQLQKGVLRYLPQGLSGEVLCIQHVV